MCGICGFVDYQNLNYSRDILGDMLGVLHHRGPDDSGTYLEKSDELAMGLAHARLSIIDLSQNGHQPMHFESFTIIFNGEIYNYEEIRLELINLGHQFISKTDTEVILHAHYEWGHMAVHRFIGMFSYSLYNKKDASLTFFRDRAGTKPLYYYYTQSLFLFSSELKSFHQHPGFIKEIDNAALALYFKLGYIPSPHSVFKDTYKLEAGHYLIFNLRSNSFAIHKYWDVNDYYASSKQVKIPYEEAKYELGILIKSACEYRMIADVPVGIFLSGGYDSSLVTALLQHDRIARLKTFTIGFQEGNNEAYSAKKIAEHLQTDHTELYCTAKDAKEIIPDLPYYFDEPFADDSTIPTILVSRLAKKKVTVALSADGGDEIFAGYNHYQSIEKHLVRLNSIPGILKGSSKIFANSLRTILPNRYVSLKHRLKGFGSTVELSRNNQVSSVYEQMSNLPEFYTDRLLRSSKPAYLTSFSKDFSDFGESLSIALAIDYSNFLQNDILTKVDRASMSVGLEAREPLLDHRILEYVAGLPNSYKYDASNSKRILKDITHQYVSKELLDRPKTGFTPPVYSWLKGECLEILQDYLCESAIKKSGLFNETFVADLKKAFLSNKLHYSQIIWRLLQFQLWNEKWM